MSARQSFYRKLLVVSAAMVFAAAAFQNCSKVKFGRPDPASSVALENGGEIYSGMTGTYLHRLTSGLCADGSDVVAAIHKSEKTVFTLLRENCANVSPPRVLDLLEISFLSETELSYQGNVYSHEDAEKIVLEEELVVGQDRPVAVCAQGVSVGESCYGLSAVGQSCDEFCATRGGTNPAGGATFMNAAAPESARTNCMTVLLLLGQDTSALSAAATQSVDTGIGCFMDLNGDAIHQVGAWTGEFAADGGRSVCPCRD